MMKERPILFSGEMVKAILEGRKTQTRRVVKFLPEFSDAEYVRIQIDERKSKYDRILHIGHEDAYAACPYGVPGDRLWVREAFYCDHSDYSQGGQLPNEPTDELRSMIYYRANGECCQQIPECGCYDVGKATWRPSIHMPRWASRITLEITNVRVERLIRITSADIANEGVEVRDLLDPRDRVERFADLWDKINGKKHPWASNPWVWVVEFKTI